METDRACDNWAIRQKKEMLFSESRLSGFFAISVSRSAGARPSTPMRRPFVLGANRRRGADS